MIGWWSNLHVERVGGVETATTAWVPGSKPIWLTEIGIPAVDKGPNGPNVFPDPKSAESALPLHSTGRRDDLVQARALSAILSRFDPAAAGHESAFNPAAPAYGGRMVDPERVSVWSWDARPFPAFPTFDTVWADGANWRTGHWITGRLEGAPIDQLLRAILADFGLDVPERLDLDGFADGYVIERPMSARQAIEPLCRLFDFDLRLHDGQVAWSHRERSLLAMFAPDDCAAVEGAPLIRRSRAQETELPAALELGFVDGEAEYVRGSVGSRRLAGTSRREVAFDTAAVLQSDEAQRLADACLQSEWAGRERVEFRLPPREITLEPGDVVALAPSLRPYRIERILDGADRAITARSVGAA